MRWKVSALWTDDTMRVPPSTTAVSVGIVISSRRRDRTRQFFSARREATEPRSAGGPGRAGRAGAGAGGGGCCGGGGGGAADSAAGLVSRSAGGLTVAPPRGALSRDGTASVPLTWLPYYLVTVLPCYRGEASARHGVSRHPADRTVCATTDTANLPDNEPCITAQPSSQ